MPRSCRILQLGAESTGAASGLLFPENPLIKRFRIYTVRSNSPHRFPSLKSDPICNIILDTTLNSCQSLQSR